MKSSSANDAIPIAAKKATTVITTFQTMFIGAPSPTVRAYTTVCRGGCRRALGRDREQAARALQRVGFERTLRRIMREGA